MKARHIWALLIICAMALNPFCAFAENADSDIPEVLYYQGGVIERGGTMFFSDVSLLDMGYALANSPYILLDAVTVWDVVISGGTQPYTCKALLAYQEDLSLDQFFDPWVVSDYFEVSGASFPYTFTSAGRYFWQFDVTDAAGQTLSFQTRIYETYTAEDETDATTVAGKVNSIIASQITPGMSDYGRALALHDWLIYNANYDHTYTNYDAAGVLLYGTGVCDSYARAYLMLMTAAGVDCMIVSGTAGTGADPANWEKHAWNLVKLGGSWYHVDCTWDDPGNGGYERHSYFCVDDETLAEDHRWKTPENVEFDEGMLVPPSDGGEYENGKYSQTDYDFTFTTWDEFGDNIEQMISDGMHLNTIIGLYVGEEKLNDVFAAMGNWLPSFAQELANRGLVRSYASGYTNNLFRCRLGWIEPTGYINIDPAIMRVSVGETKTVTSTDFYPAADAFTVASSDASVATASAVYDGGANSVEIAVTGKSAGTVTITVAPENGAPDFIEVSVLPAYEPDFGIAAVESSGEYEINWELIPGATEYRVMYACEGGTTCLGTVTEGSYAFSSSLIQRNALNELYVDAVRVVGGRDAAVYSSEALVFVELDFDAVLPAGIVTIDGEAFAGDAVLDSVYIPDGAKTICAEAFADTGIGVIRVPASVDSISADAFRGSDIDFVQTKKGCPADEWFRQNMADAYIKYE